MKTLETALRAKKRTRSQVPELSAANSAVNSIANADASLQKRQAQNARLVALLDSFEDDPVQQAREFYDTELRSRMEELYNGHYIAIHPESRSYKVESGYGKAFRALRMQQPFGPIIVHNIGFANSGLKARLRGEQPR